MTTPPAAPQRRTNVRALVLAAAKQRAAEALRLKDDTPLFAPYSPSPHAMIDALWDYLAHENVTIAPQDLIVDLGCGDARWLVSGVQRFGCSALGIELDEAVVAKAMRNVEQQQLQHKVRVVQGDIMQVDIAQARLVIVYAFAESLQGIREHLATQLNASASVLSIGFRVPDWKAKWSDRVGGLRWYYYEMQDCL